MDNEHQHLYIRAGLRTPAENSIREIVGGHLWLHYLLELVLTKLEAPSPPHVVWIPTKSTSTFPFQNHPNVTVLKTAIDPWGWEEDKEDDDSSIQWNDLSKLKQAILDQIQMQTQATPQRKTVIIWESLTPLLLRHGLSKTLSFLGQLVPDTTATLMILPIRTESLNPLQHAQLEDFCQCVLWLQQGEMTLVRQGIRETGNIVRETLPFSLELLQGTTTTNNHHRYRLVELEQEEGVVVAKLEIATDPSHAAAAGGPTSTDAPGGTVTPHVRPSAAAAASSSKPKKIQLQMEEDTPPAAAPQSSNRPRIFLQDDDPEFDDFDEEDDLDDDLDM
jgi:hypothetical protein